jgi:hypothetical protein
VTKAQRYHDLCKKYGVKEADYEWAANGYGSVSYPLEVEANYAVVFSGYKRSEDDYYHFVGTYKWLHEAADVIKTQLLGHDASVEKIVDLNQGLEFDYEVTVELKLKRGHQ